jgi:hypothetical protein
MRALAFVDADRKLIRPVCKGSRREHHVFYECFGSIIIDHASQNPRIVNEN